MLLMVFNGYNKNVYMLKIIQIKWFNINTNDLKPLLIIFRENLIKIYSIFEVNTVIKKSRKTTPYAIEIYKVQNSNN